MCETWRKVTQKCKNMQWCYQNLKYESLRTFYTASFAGGGGGSNVCRKVWLKQKKCTAKFSSCLLWDLINNKTIHNLKLRVFISEHNWMQHYLTSMQFAFSFIILYSEHYNRIRGWIATIQNPVSCGTCQVCQLTIIWWDWFCRGMQCLFFDWHITLVLAFMWSFSHRYNATNMALEFKQRQRSMMLYSPEITGSCLNLSLMSISM